MRAHAFSLRDGWGRLLEKQGVVQETSREAWAPMEGEPRPTVLGERHGARHRRLRSGRGTGPSAKRSTVWESAGKSRLLEDLKAWAWEAGAKAVEDQSPSAEDVTDEVEQALRYWDIVWKPNEDWLKAQGRPRAWIEADVKRWKQQRQERRRELVGQATD